MCRLGNDESNNCAKPFNFAHYLGNDGQTNEKLLGRKAVFFTSVVGWIFWMSLGKNNQ